MEKKTIEEFRKARIVKAKEKKKTSKFTITLINSSAFMIKDNSNTIAAYIALQEKPVTPAKNKFAGLASNMLSDFAFIEEVEALEFNIFNA